MSLPRPRSNSDPNNLSPSMTKYDATSENFDKKKKSFIPKIFSTKKNGKHWDDVLLRPADFEDKTAARRQAFMEAAPIIRKSFSALEPNLTIAKNKTLYDAERHGTIEGLNLTNYELSMATETQFHDFRIFVGTWNVGGKAPNNGLNLEDFLQVEGASDIYVLGFQEIVPLNAGNVLVIEDNEPAAKWLALICQALNKPQDENSANDSSDSSHGSKSRSNKDSKSKFFNKPNLKVLARNCKVNGSLVKACNCPFESVVVPRRQLDEPLNKLDYLVTTKLREDSNIEGFLATAGIPTTTNQLNYRLVASKQMVGIFLSVWAKNDLVKHIGHLRISCVGRGIMGCLGNKGCISISMTIFQTSFCFVCSHLASGEKEGDELRRNADVAEILKSSQFPKICKNPTSPIPEKILDHDRIIWLGDLNYRVSLGYEETRALLEDNDWDTLLVRDQLNVEREAGRVFSGFKEGRILFAPTYKYSHNSDSYAGETTKSKKKRRTPAWCDRILWHGNGIEQLSYIRGESRFSDHRPVCAVFQVEVEMRAKTSKYRKGFSFVPSRVEYDDSIPKDIAFMTNKFFRPQMFNYPITWSLSK